MGNKIRSPIITTYVDEHLAVSLDMIDTDELRQSVEGRFKAGEDLQEGVAGRSAIDSEYENTHESVSETPRSGEHAPKLRDRFMFPHR